MRVFVTGAAGAVGSRLAPGPAARGHGVVATGGDAAGSDALAVDVVEDDLLASFAPTVDGGTA